MQAVEFRGRDIGWVTERASYIPSSMKATAAITCKVADDEGIQF